MQDFFKHHHPGGAYTMSLERDVQMRPTTLHEAFKWLFKKSKWKVMRGFHVFRHSFASNLARAGVDQRVIDDLMGHQTEDMRRRYRHFTLQQKDEAIRKLYG
jgi:integrase